jgi:hypothetical protein
MSGKTRAALSGGQSGIAVMKKLLVFCAAGNGTGGL